MWPALRIVPMHEPVSRARRAHSCVAFSAATWPHPWCASQTTADGASRSSSSSVGETVSPLRADATYEGTRMTPCDS